MSEGKYRVNEQGKDHISYKFWRVLFYLDHRVVIFAVHRFCQFFDLIQVFSHFVSTIPTGFSKLTLFSVEYYPLLIWGGGL